MEFIEYLLGEAKVIAQAPVTFVALAAVLLLMAYLFVRHQFSDRMETMRERLQLKDDRITDYEAKLHGRSPDEAAAVIEDLKRRLAALEPRALSSEDFATLHQALAGQSFTIDIAHDAASAEGKKLHGQLAAVFRQSGWRVGTSMVMGLGDPPVSGLGVSGKANSPAMNAVAAAFSRARLKHDVQTRSALRRSDIDVELVVTTPADLAS